MLEHNPWKKYLVYLFLDSIFLTLGILFGIEPTQCSLVWSVLPRKRAKSWTVCRTISSPRPRYEQQKKHPSKCSQGLVILWKKKSPGFFLLVSFWRGQWAMKALLDKAPSSVVHFGPRDICSSKTTSHFWCFIISLSPFFSERIVLATFFFHGIKFNVLLFIFLLF